MSTILSATSKQGVGKREGGRFLSRPLGETQCENLAGPQQELQIAPLGGTQCVLRNRKAQNQPLFGQEVCRKIWLGQTQVTKRLHRSMWKIFEKTALFASSSLQKRTMTQSEMENKNPDVKFILEALVGGLMTLTAE